MTLEEQSSGLFVPARVHTHNTISPCCAYLPAVSGNLQVSLWLFERGLALFPPHGIQITPVDFSEGYS